MDWRPSKVNRERGPVALAEVPTSGAWPTITREESPMCLGITEQLTAARVVKVSSDSGVELEQAAESVATANGPALR